VWGDHGVIPLSGEQPNRLSPTGQKSIMWITRKSGFISVVIAALAVIGPTIGASADSRGNDRDTATANGETSADEVAGNEGSTRTADRAAAS